MSRTLHHRTYLEQYQMSPRHLCLTGSACIPSTRPNQIILVVKTCLYRRKHPYLSLILDLSAPYRVLRTFGPGNRCRVHIGVPETAPFGGFPQHHQFRHPRQSSRWNYTSYMIDRHPRASHSTLMTLEVVADSSVRRRLAGWHPRFPDLREH